MLLYLNAWSDRKVISSRNNFHQTTSKNSDPLFISRVMHFEEESVKMKLNELERQPAYLLGGGQTQRKIHITLSPTEQWTRTQLSIVLHFYLHRCVHTYQSRSTMDDDDGQMTSHTHTRTHIQRHISSSQPAHNYLLSVLMYSSLPSFNSPPPRSLVLARS